jgi:hypothetical protein
MKVYICGQCGNPLYFENRFCLSCNRPVGFDADALSMITLEERGTGEYISISHRQSSYRFCRNAEYDACNWLVKVGASSSFCRACILNRIIPSISNPDNLRRWQRIESAKRRLVYS